MTRCDRCHIRLTRPPISFQGLTLGPRCAQVLGYVAPAAVRASVAPKAAGRGASKAVAQEVDRDLFGYDIDRAARFANLRFSAWLDQVVADAHAEVHAGFVQAWERVTA